MSFHLEAKLLSYCCSSTQYLWSKASFSFCLMVNFSFGPPDNYCLILGRNTGMNHKHRANGVFEDGCLFVRGEIRYFPFSYGKTKQIIIGITCFTLVNPPGLQAEKKFRSPRALKGQA